MSIDDEHSESKVIGLNVERSVFYIPGIWRTKDLADELHRIVVKI